MKISALRMLAPVALLVVLLAPASAAAKIRPLTHVPGLSLSTCSPGATGPIVSFSVTPTFPTGLNGWYTDASLVLGATATTSAPGCTVATITMRSGGSPAPSVVSPLLLPPVFGCNDEVLFPGASTGPVLYHCEGFRSVSYWATDDGGNTGPVGFTHIYEDSVKPSVVVTRPAEGSVYPLDKVVTAAFKCADHTSGVGSCVGTVANGAHLDTSTVSTHAFTVTGTDKAGNVQALTHHYTVDYTWNGFYAPIANTETSRLNLVHAGDLIKIGFGLDGNRGLSIFAGGSPTSVAVACPAWTPHTVPAAGSGSSAGLSYGVASGHYTYGWPTSAAWAGTCRQFQLGLNDGTPLHTAVFMFFA